MWDGFTHQSLGGSTVGSAWISVVDDWGIASTTQYIGDDRFTNIHHKP